ncbi:MAG: V-type ATP synthase subunit D [Candidatus Bathyarchaeota archaeon]
MSARKVSPTRINLIRTKKTLQQSKSGLDLLERKRDVLIRELRHFSYDAKKLRDAVITALSAAYQDLIESKIIMGSETVDNVSLAFSLKENFILDHQSIMGVTVPIVKLQRDKDSKPEYGFADTSVLLDQTFKNFSDILEQIAQLAELEGSIYRIADDVQKTQKRVNALKHIFIPMYSELVKRIELVLEEKEREEFIRMKTAKRMISK